MIVLNHAVAIALSSGLDEGLKQIDALGTSSELYEYYLFHSARAEILRRMNHPAEAADAYRRALALVTNLIEREFLMRRLKEIEDVLQ